MSKQTKYIVVVQAPAVNEWKYEITATSLDAAERIIRKAIQDGDELPDPVAFEQGKELDGEPLFVADSYEL